VLNRLNGYFARSIAKHERGLYSVSVESPSAREGLKEISIATLLSEEIQMVAPHLIEPDTWTLGEDMYVYRRTYPPLKSVTEAGD
jgi:hypothetical protein